VKTLGKDHVDTLDIIDNMANVFYSQGEYSKALEWYQRALDSRENTLGKDHLDNLYTVNNRVPNNPSSPIPGKD
jgi:tetratricopeptide (TPR) repeat protein